MTSIRSRESWDAVADQWMGSGADRLWRRHSDRLNARLVESWLPEHVPRLLKTDLFDEVVGDGLLASRLASRAGLFVGVDLSSHVVSGVEQPGIVGVVADIRQLPFCNESLDLIFSNSTLDHFNSAQEIDRSFAEIHRTLRVGGTLIVTLDNASNPVIALRNRMPDSLLRRLGWVPYPVGVTLGRAGLVRGLRKAGFRIEQTKAILHCPRILAVWRSRQVAKAGAVDQERFLGALAGWERLGGWPTRHLTAHFVAAKATRI